MTKSDRDLVVQCAKILVQQSATLQALTEGSTINQVASYKELRSYKDQDKLSQPHLKLMEELAPGRQTEQEFFDTLRKLLGTVATPSL